MKLYFGAALVVLSFQSIAYCDEPKATANHINAKTLYDGNDLDGGGTADDGRVSPARAPTSKGADLPYSDEELKQADPGYNTNKNMPIDQD